MARGSSQTPRTIIRRRSGVGVDLAAQALERRLAKLLAGSTNRKAAEEQWSAFVDLLPAVGLAERDRVRRHLLELALTEPGNRDGGLLNAYAVNYLKQVRAEPVESPWLVFRTAKTGIVDSELHLRRSPFGKKTICGERIDEHFYVAQRGAWQSHFQLKHTRHCGQCESEARGRAAKAAAEKKDFVVLRQEDRERVERYAQEQLEMLLVDRQAKSPLIELQCQLAEELCAIAAERIAADPDAWLNRIAHSDSRLEELVTEIRVRYPDCEKTIAAEPELARLLSCGFRSTEYGRTGFGYRPRLLKYGHGSIHLRSTPLAGLIAHHFPDIGQVIVIQAARRGDGKEGDPLAVSMLTAFEQFRNGSWS